MTAATTILLFLDFLLKNDIVILAFFEKIWLKYECLRSHKSSKVTRDETRRAVNDVNNRHTTLQCTATTFSFEKYQNWHVLAPENYLKIRLCYIVRDRDRLSAKRQVHTGSNERSFAHCCHSLCQSSTVLQEKKFQFLSPEIWANSTDLHHFLFS